MYRTVWLWLLVILVGIQFGAGWYEKLAIAPCGPTHRPIRCWRRWKVRG
jgi:hypothetical protein